MIDIFTFDYNSSELTNACVKSILKNKSIHDISKRLHIFQNGIETVKLDDSIQTDIEIIAVSANKTFNRPKPDNQHSFCIQYALNTAQSDDILICDCDILFKPDADTAEIIDNKYVSSGQLALYPNDRLNRIHPCLQYLNRKIMQQNNVMFYNGKTYATGDYFYHQIMEKCLPIKNIQTGKYCYHLRISTYDNGNSESHFQKQCHTDFINKYSDCWR